MSQTKVLVVDDEPEILQLIRRCLEIEDYEVLVASSGAEGLRTFFKHRPDLVLLDIIMPELDGLELCRRIREMSTVPIIFLTALANEENMVQGLKLGADDYVTKPVGMKELAARVGAALRRAQTPPSADMETLYKDSFLTIDTAAHRVFVQGKEIDLTPLEYKLILYLVRNGDKLLTIDQILDNVWGEEYDSPDAVKWYISQLRKKIEPKPANPQLITTVRGHGYRYSKR